MLDKNGGDDDVVEPPPTQLDVLRAMSTILRYIAHLHQ